MLRGVRSSSRHLDGRRPVLAGGMGLLVNEQSRRK
jgi:hypothetical protein